MTVVSHGSHIVLIGTCHDDDFGFRPS
jgi:hypothetical protein